MDQPLFPHSVSAAYEAAQKRTFLPLLILIAVCLPFLFGLILLYLFQVTLSKNKDKYEHYQNGRFTVQESRQSLLGQMESSHVDSEMTDID